MKYSNLLRLVNWWVFVKCEPKSSQLKEPKTQTISVCVHWIYLIHEFHNLSWITEINELFHDIPIYCDAPVYTHIPGQMFEIFKNLNAFFKMYFMLRLHLFG